MSELQNGESERQGIAADSQYDRRARVLARMQETDTVACGDCGALHEEASEYVSLLRERINGLEERAEEQGQTIERQSREMNRLERRVRWLLSDIDKQVTSSPHYAAAIEVLEFWREHCHPGARELHGERLKKVIARLDGKPKPYTKEELKQAIVGYSKFPYVVDGRRVRVGTPGQRYIDAELVFRDPKHVDQGIALAKEAELRAAPLPEVSTDANGLSELGQMATRLVKKMGWHIFPVLPKSKVPATPNGLLDATVEVARVVRFWIRKPEHNIGVRCGVPSEIFVLDVDGGGGFESLRELEMEHGELPRTLSVKTPRGGEHYYFRHPGGKIRNTVGFPGLGLDIRADGGYVLAPPSIGPNGRAYEVDERVPVADPPAWLVKMLLDYQRRMKEVDVNDLAKFFEGVAEGGRNGALTQQVGKLFRRGFTKPEVLGHAIAINHEYCRPPLENKEVKTIVDSIARCDRRSQENRTRATLEGLKCQEAVS